MERCVPPPHRERSMEITFVGFLNIVDKTANNLGGTDN